MADKQIEPKPNKSEIVDEKELDELLDSALDDFNSMKIEKKPNTSEATPNMNPEDWSKMFTEEHKKQFQENMADLFGASGDNEEWSEQMNLGFKKIAEASMAVLNEGVPVGGEGDEFAKKITETLKEFRDGTANIAPKLDPNDVTSLFGSLNPQGGDGDSNPFLPFVQGMLQSLLSAEILLPSIKDLLDKYPKFLEEQGDKISPEDKERYLKQQELFQVICTELEKESPTDSTEVSQQRFKVLLEHLNKLHTYGQPPMELIGENGFDFMNGVGGVPDMSALGGVPDLAAFGGGAGQPQNPDQCNLM